MMSTVDLIAARNRQEVIRSPQRCCPRFRGGVRLVLGAIERGIFFSASSMAAPL